MLSLEFLKGPLMNAAAKLPGMPTPGTGTTAPKPMLGGMFGKAGKLLSPLPTADAGAPPVPPRLATPNFDPLATRMPAVRLPDTAPTVEETPIPTLPGRTGGPRPFDPQTKAEFDYVMSKVPRDEAGNERKLTFGERFKKSLLPTLLGTVQGINARPDNPLGGAIGGATAGFAGGMIDPISARQYEWNQMYKPEMDAQQTAREEMNAERQRNEEGLVNLEARRAGIDYTKAQTDAMRANNQANQAYKQSQIELNRARAEAIATGKPQVRDVVDETGQIRTYNVYPDGSMVELGGSAKAAMNTENNQTRLGITDKQIAGRKDVAQMNAAEAMKRTVYKDRGQTTRTAMSQAGQDRRANSGGGTATKLPVKPSSKAAPRSSRRQAFIDDAIADGHDRALAEAEANRRGLK